MDICLDYRNVYSLVSLPNLRVHYIVLSYSKKLKCLCIENFEYTFLAKIETSVFPMHEYHIIFVLTGEKGVEISICFEALGANFNSHCVMS